MLLRFLTQYTLVGADIIRPVFHFKTENRPLSLSFSLFYNLLNNRHNIHIIPRNPSGTNLLQ